MKSAQHALHAEIEERHWWFLGRRQIMQDLIRQVLPPAQKGTVLDVGCGTGGNIAALAADYSCVGIDDSADAVEWAQRRFPGTRFLRGSLSDGVGAEGREADLILLMDVLEHVPDDFIFLSTILTGMKPGAHLLITVPAEEALWSGHDVSFGHYRRYDARRLGAVWADLPVSVRLLSHYNARLYPAVKLARSMSRLRGKAAGAAGTDFSLPPPPVNRLLERIFAGESRRLVRILQGDGAKPFSRGVSLIALLRREPGEIRPRTKPAGVPSDLHTPIGNSNGH